MTTQNGAVRVCGGRPVGTSSAVIVTMRRLHFLCPHLNSEWFLKRGLSLKWPVIYSSLTEMPQSVSLHSLSQTRPGSMPSVGFYGMLSSSIDSQVPSKLGSFWPNLAAFEAHVRRELFSFQCEKRQISRSESTFSFQRRHMHAPQSGVNGLCEECLEDVNRERRSSAVRCGLFVYSV